MTLKFAEQLPSNLVEEKGTLVTFNVMTVIYSSLKTAQAAGYA